MKKIIIGFIKFYQYTLAYFLGGNCRFSPSCSNYAIEAVNKKGAYKGSLLTIKRICKCHPFGEYGFDPVEKGER